MFYTSAWCTSDESTFRRELPFELLGSSMKRYHSTIPFYIVLLEGAELLSPAYLDLLGTMGFTVIDHSAAFRRIVDSYPNINAQYSIYERNCLLRWIAFRGLFEGHPDRPTQFWHLDGDVLLHASLDQLARDTAGKTFMLQGCPVLLTVSDRRWFAIYESSLHELEKDPVGYSNNAAAERAACRMNDRELANNSFYRNPIGHDQDLLEYLVSSKKIPQDDRSVIYRSGYYFIENPLAFNLATFDDQGEEKVSFEMKDGLMIGAGSKSVPFIHYQNSFARWAQLFLVLKSWHLPAGIIARILRYRIREDKFETTLLYKLLSKGWFGCHPDWGRSRVMKGLLANEKGSTIADLLNFLKKYQAHHEENDSR